MNQEFCARMNGSARIHLTPALVKGRYIVRFAAIQENCSEAQVEGAWNTIQEFAEDILSELKPQVRRHSLPTKYDQTHKDRYAFTRIVTKEIYDKQAKMLVVVSVTICQSIFNFFIFQQSKACGRSHANRQNRNGRVDSFRSQSRRRRSPGK